MTDTAIPSPQGALGGTVSGLGTLLHVATSAASLGVVGLLVLWGWQTVGRDVADVPVLQAQAGVMRVLPPPPEDEALPLPEIAAVARGEGVPPAPALAKLAPEGEGLAPEDLRPVPVETPPAFVSAPGAPAAETPVPGGTPAPGALASDALAPETPAILETVALGVPGVGRSPRPLPRGAAGTPARASVPEPVPAVAIAPAPKLAAGAPLAQVGTFRTEEAARTDWARLARRYGPLFEGRDAVITAVSGQGRALYLLRAGGFAEPAEAAIFCAALSAAGTECLPATQR